MFFNKTKGADGISHTGANRMPLGAFSKFDPNTSLEKAGKMLLPKRKANYKYLV